MSRTYNHKPDAKKEIVNLRARRREVIEAKQRSGAGVHEDRRTKRDRTRSDQRRNAVAASLRGE